MKSLLTFLHKSTLGDCTNGGITTKEKQFYLVTEESFISELNNPNNDDSNILVLVERLIGDTKYLHARPTKKYIEKYHKGMSGPMFGGNFIYTSDSRFPNNYPIPVHDRFEVYIP